jgi:hypothetical protein
MKPPLARIVHQTRSRVRLRIAEKRKDPGYFEDLRDQLATVPGITELKINSTTGCVVLLHPELPWSELEPGLRMAELFEITDTPEPARPALEPLTSGLSRMDQAVTSGTDGSVDLRTLAYVGLMGFTISQALRGELLGPAIPLLFNAMSLLDRITKTADGESVNRDSVE